MRKTILGLLTAATILSAGTATAFAAVPETGCSFIDADGDGICDHYADTDNDGTCDHYTDADNDEICGHCADADNDRTCDHSPVRQGRGCRNGVRGGRCR